MFGVVVSTIIFFIGGYIISKLKEYWNIRTSYDSITDDNGNILLDSYSSSSSYPYNRRRISFSDTLLYLIYCIINAVILTNVIIQLNSLHSQYNKEIEKTSRDINTLELCRNGKITTTDKENDSNHKNEYSDEFDEVCRKAEITLTMHPMTRAIKHVISSWHSCINIPCEELISEIFKRLEYKIYLSIFVIFISIMFF